MRDENMSYTVKSSERLRKSGSEAETKALLYLMNFRPDSDDIYYFVVDFFNDLTGMDNMASRLWDVQSKGAHHVSPKAIGKELVTLFKNYMSPLTFEAYILFIGSVTGSLRKDSSLTTFGIENVKDAAIEQIKLGLHEEGSAKEYIDSTDLTDENINGFLRKVFFVIDDGKKPSEYVKAIIRQHPNIIPEEKILNAIFNEIRDKQASKKNISSVEGIVIEKRTLWIATMTLLNSDPIFANNGASALLSPQGTEEGELVVSAQELFSRLSSGHKVILLTLTCLVAITMERTLVLMDEPENHLHPPLLSAFVRALSALLIQKNGLAIISTHSPVILQEVPKNCIWQLYRNNTILRAVRPERETFGENVGVLINDVFGLEVTHSGFHGMLLQMVEAGLTYEEILNKFDFRVGMEARSILRILLANREYGGTE